MMVEKTSDAVKWEADLLCPAGRLYPAAWQLHAFTLPSPCCFFIPPWSAFCHQGLLTAAVSLLSWGCAGSVGWRGVPPGAVFSCLTYSKIRNCISWIQDEDELGSLPSLKLVPSWFACPVNGKKTELPLNSLDKTHWQLCLHIWSFKVLWLHVGVLQSSLDFTSVLYCCGWSQALIYPDPMQTEVLWSCLVCETQSNG